MSVFSLISEDKTVHFDKMDINQKTNLTFLLLGNFLLLSVKLFDGFLFLSLYLFFPFLLHFFSNTALLYQVYYYKIQGNFSE